MLFPVDKFRETNYTHKPAQFQYQETNETSGSFFPMSSFSENIQFKMVKGGQP